eukprot:SAG22_NODE_1648_length_3898_cov_6.783890_3_plen_132_part_00
MRSVCLPACLSVSQAHTRIRTLEANVNTGQTDWWDKKLKSAQKWTARRDRLYGPEGANRRGQVAVGHGKQVDAEWEALNHMTQAVDVSLRRTCGQLRLRTSACQTDVTWYRGEVSRQLGTVFLLCFHCNSV